MKNIFTIAYSEEEANVIGHFIMSKVMKVYKMTVIDIVGRKFGGHLNKLKNIILILFMLV